MLWNHSYETGLAEIDKQNYDLISQLDTMSDPDTNRERFERLVDFEQTVMEYFEREQKMHCECNYCGADMHRYAHTGYLNHLRRIERDYVERGATLQNEMFFLKNAVESLKKHIMNQDKSFAEFYKKTVIEEKAL